MLRSVIIVFIICGTSFATLAQIVSGKVVDNRQQPVSDVIVIAKISDSNIQRQITDDNGFFQYENVPYGKITFEIFKEGYQTLFIDTWYSIQSRNYFEFTIDYEMNIVVDSLTITASNQLAEFNGTVSLKRDQYKTMAGSFQDPSRVLVHYPGFTTNNDGTNQFSYRGLPDYSTYWQVFDAEILNPNHLSTAGNRSDAVSQQSGGVNSLTSSVIDQYTFQPIGTSISQSNAIGGVSNITLNKKINNYADVSLIGAEAGVCLKIGDKSIYGTGRYSFVGLLEKMGIPFGNESINYQDFTLHSEIIKTKKVSLQGYAAYGQSSNVHNALEPEEEKLVYKDFQNIRYTGKFGLIGLQAQISLSSNHKINFTANYSLRNDSHHQHLDSIYHGIISYILINNTDYSRLGSVHAQYNFWSKRHYLKVGMRCNILDQVSKSFITINNSETIRYYPYAEYQYRIKKYLFTGGLALHSSHINDLRYTNLTEFFNYCISIERTIFSKIKIKIQNRRADQYYSDKANIVAQFPFIPVYYFSNLNSNSSEISVSSQSKVLSWRVAAFYNIMDGFISVNSDERSFVSTFNGSDFGVESLIKETLSPFSKGRSLGVEGWAHGFVTLSENSKLECSGSAALIRSQYEGFNGFDLIWFPGKYDVGFMGSFSSYVTIQRKSKEWIFGFNFHGREGTREYVTDLNNPNLYETNRGMTNQLSPYMRLDARIVYSKKGGKNRRHRISLDIQNVTNRLNDGYSYIDAYLMSVNRVNQLGLVPVLGYRFEY